MELPLKICGRFEVPDFAGKCFTHMISIGDHDDFLDGLRLPEIEECNHLCLRFTDTEKPTHPDAPNEARLEPLFQWFGQSKSIGGLLVHCAAGISRSPAVATLSLCFLFPDLEPLEIMERVASAAECSQIWPNPLVVELGDQLLDRGGAIIRGVDMWRYRPGSDPFGLT